MLVKKVAINDMSTSVDHKVAINDVSSNVG